MMTIGPSKDFVIGECRACLAVIATDISWGRKPNRRDATLCECCEVEGNATELRRGILPPLEDSFHNKCIFCGTRFTTDNGRHRICGRCANEHN